MREDVNLYPNPQRRNIFDGATFVFFESNNDVCGGAGSAVQFLANACTHTRVRLLSYPGYCSLSSLVFDVG